MTLFLICVILILVATLIFWFLDHAYLLDRIWCLQKEMHDEKTLKESYKLSCKGFEAQIVHLKQEKADFAFKVSQETATLKAKIKTVARELDEMVK